MPGPMMTNHALRPLRRLLAEGSLAGMTDAQLLARFAERRDEVAFAALVERHGRMVLATCRGAARDAHDADDAYQATFLALALRADRLWAEGGSLAAWLHRVAHRAASKAAAGAARRRAAECRASSDRAVETASGVDRDELRAAVHHEVARLPDRLRRPVVLCDLSGLTYAQAAAELGLGEATVRRRRANAHGLIRARLERRGVSPSMAPIAAILGRAGASIPASVTADALSKAATAVALAGRATAAAGLAPAAIGLAVRALPTALPIRSAVAAAILIAVGATAGPAWTVAPATPGGGDDSATHSESERPAPAADLAIKADSEETSVIVVSGQVVGPDGRPASGASVRATEGDESTHVETDAEGRFRLPVAEEVPRYGVGLVATRDGYAPGFVTAKGGATPGDTIIRLKEDDPPIVGRVLDLEGRPVAWATVRPIRVREPDGGDLSAWLEVARAGNAGSTELENRFLDNRITAEDFGLPSELTTDAEGRFRLGGVGRERVVELQIVGPTIRFADVHVMTRPGEPFDLTYAAGSTDWGVRQYYGATFDHVASAGRPIVGVVRDLDTGAPLPGVTVRSDQFAEFPAVGVNDLEATTDAEGRYRLEGMSPGPGNRIVAHPPIDEPYFGSNVEVRDRPGLEPVATDIALKRGLWIEGRVTDAETGKPVREGRMFYGIFRDDPHYEPSLGLDGARYGSEFAIADDGSYRVPGLLGHGVVGVLWASSPGVNYLRLPDRPGGAGTYEYLDVAPAWMHPANFNEVAEVNVPDGSESFRCDLALTPSRTLTVAVLDPDGQPLSGARVASDGFGWTVPKEDATFTLEGMASEGRRTLRIRHEGRGLIGIFEIDLAEGGPIEARLEPWGVASGRLVDEDGRPRAGVWLDVEASLDGEEIGSVTGYGYGEQPQTDPDGRFRIEGLFPGLQHAVRATENVSMRGDVIVEKLEVEAGETRDLGDVREEERRR